MVLVTYRDRFDGYSLGREAVGQLRRGEGRLRRDLMRTPGWGGDVPQ